jgi:hypothetical protein
MTFALGWHALRLWEGRGKGSVQAHHRLSAVWKRVGSTLLSSLVVVASLLTFPEFTAWMIAVWLAWHTVRVWQGKPGWLPLVSCLTIVLVKRLYWSPGLVVLLIAMAGVAGLRLNRSRTSDSLKDTRLAWTGGPYLSDDGLHCNARGNQHLADYVAAALDRMYGPKVRANHGAQ